MASNSFFIFLKVKIMTTAPEPAMYHSPLEPDTNYLAVLDKAGTRATLNFGWYHALTELERLQLTAVSDISFADRCVAGEVKTPGDLATSFRDGRLFESNWHMHLLREYGAIQDYCFVIRNIQQEINEKAEYAFTSACEWLARDEDRYDFKLFIARHDEDVIRVMKSFAREHRDPKPRSMPAPVIKKELLEWPFAIQSLCMIPGIGIELAKQLMARKSYWEIFIDAHEMTGTNFIVNYSDLFNFGGKDHVRLSAIWTAFNNEEKFTAPIPVKH